MARRPRMATLWEVSDTLWERIQPLLEGTNVPKPTGRPRADRRRALDGIIFQYRTGCPWNHIPRVFGDDSTIHRYYRDWSSRGILTQIWDLLLEECRDLASAAEAPAAGLAASGHPGWVHLPGSAHASAQSKSPSGIARSSFGW